MGVVEGVLRGGGVLVVLLRFGRSEESNSNGPADNDAQRAEEDEVYSFDRDGRRSAQRNCARVQDRRGERTGEGSTELRVFGVVRSPAQGHVLADEGLHEGDGKRVGVLEHGAGD